MGRNRRRYNKVNLNKKAIKTLSAIIVILIIILLCFMVKYFSKNNKTEKISQNINASSEEENNEETTEASSDDKGGETENKKTETKKTNTTITLTAIGDVMCHNTQYQDAYDSTTGTYDFSYVFEDVKYYIQTADIAIGNLETTFAGKSVGYSGYPTFNTPEVMAQNLKDIGIDVLTTANNHSLDKGYAGIESTIKYLDEADISHTGTFTSEEAQNTILVKNVKGIKIAFLSFTYGTNGIAIPSGKEYCINLIDKDFILEQINLAKEENPDVICVSMHWGVEYQTTPNSTQKDLADFLFENGADIILGSHPHVLQPMEKRTITLEDGTTKDGFIIYSFGNFISGQTKANTKDSIILNLKITKNGETGKITIDDYSYIPVYMYKASSGTQKYKLLDINRRIENYEAGNSLQTDYSTYTTLTTELENIKKILGE
jgi:poly-gamma-glutamate synthesis protein (capsule biosynthesis protein)